MWRRMSLNRQSLRTCIVAGLVGSSLLVVLLLTSGAGAFEIASFLTLMVLMLGLVFGLTYLTLPRRSRKIYSQTASLGERQEYLLDEEGFSVSQESGSARAKWADLYMWDEDENVFLMHPNSMQAYLIPKSQVDPLVIDFAKARLSTYGLPRKGRPRK